MPRRALPALALLASCGGAAPGVAPPRLETSVATVASARTLTPGETHAAFEASDPTTDEGAHVHVWRIELLPAHRVRIHVRSDEVDPKIEVSSPNGQRLRNDDAFPGATLDALVDFVPSEAGVYEVRTTTAVPGQRGAYTIAVEARDHAGVGLAYELGSRVDAVLGEHGQPGLPGTWLHFEGQAGSIVRLRVTSSAFDTVATLLGPGGQTWVNDDANDLGPNGDERSLDSTIVAALPQSGVYQLVVTSYGRGAGPFVVRSEVRAPLVLGPDGRRPDGLAGPHGGRVLGLYAGISAYAGDHAPLYGCADDARMLARAMRASHVQDEGDQIVLPDGLATREGFLGGLRRIAEQARPQDVVLVFFSGHGQQVPDLDHDGRELDGLDETIVLYDGSLTDDEVVRAMEPIAAGTIVLAIDACHSGGFAERLRHAVGSHGPLLERRGRAERHGRAAPCGRLSLVAPPAGRFGRSGRAPARRDAHRGRARRLPARRLRRRPPRHEPARRARSRAAPRRAPRWGRVGSPPVGLPAERGSRAARAPRSASHQPAAAVSSALVTAPRRSGRAA